MPGRFINLRSENFPELRGEAPAASIARILGARRYARFDLGSRQRYFAVFVHQRAVRTEEDRSVVNEMAVAFDDACNQLNMV